MPVLVCSQCGRVHHPVPLRFGERALCVDCGSRLPSRPNADRALAFGLTAAALAFPALQLPVVTVRKFGAEHASYLWTGVRTLWHNGMPVLSIWVAFCGIIIPLALLATVLMSVPPLATEMSTRSSRLWTRAAAAFEHWSMPEVQVLAVLVAFAKIGALVEVTPGPGLWAYGAMTIALLLAWRSLGPTSPAE